MSSKNLVSSPDPDLPDPKRMERFRAKGGVLLAMLFREQRQAERRAQLQRVRDINAPRAAGPDGEDHGDDLGPAALARFSTIERVGGRISGAGQKKAAPVYARRIVAKNLFESMNEAAQLSDRRALAGQRLWLLRRAAGVEQRITPRYAVVHDRPDDADEDAEIVDSICPEGFDPRTYYRAILRDLPAHMAFLLERACDWTPEYPTGHPGVRYLATFQVALDRVADAFGLKREDRA